MLQPKNPVLQPQNRPLHHGRAKLHPYVSLLQPKREDKRPRLLATSYLKLKRATRSAALAAGPSLARTGAEDARPEPRRCRPALSCGEV
jgi:hypothetical protein